MQTETILLIRNPESGTASGWDEVRDLIEADAGIEVRTTERSGDAAKLAREARARGVGTIVAVGGDGTVSEVVQGLGAGAGDIAIGIVPMGTGNDTIRSLGIPEDPVQAFEILRSGRRAAIDLIEVEIDGRTTWALNACTGGFSAEVTSSITDEVKERWGRYAYLRCALDVLGEIPSHVAQIRLDGGELRQEEIVQLVVGNGRFAGHGIAVAPDALMDDGLLDLVVARFAALPRLLALLPDVLQAETPRSELIGSWRGREIEVSLDPPMAVSIDGEVSEAHELRFTVRPGAGTVIVPVDRPAQGALSAA